MGLCSSSQAPKASVEEQAASKKLEAKLQNEFQEEKAVHKLLLLGAGESGKSTLFKQMIQIYGKGFPDAERASFASIIHNNVLTSMKTLIKYSATYGPVAPQNERSRAVIDDLKGDEEITSEIGAHVQALWEDPGIQATYSQRTLYQLNDSAKYFFDRIAEISKNGYLPTQQDVLRSRVRTTGIVENDFEIDGNKFKMFDVGGQRNERKKWIHCFENVTAVLFVAAISEYDQVLYEDESTNRITEALNLFEEICNSRWFSRTSVILMLNKRDLFAEKIEKSPLTTAFPDYDGPQTYEAGVQFMKQAFEGRNRNQEKMIYTHVTCATDTQNIAVVFGAVKDTIIRQSLNEAGLT